MKTPEAIKPHASKYKDHAWEDYTPEELANWTYLFLKRSKHRTQRTKAMKDILDAQNYWEMYQTMQNTLIADAKKEAEKLPE